MKKITKNSQKTKYINLFDGVFTTVEAKDIAVTLLNKKNNHHKTKTLSIIEENLESGYMHNRNRTDQLAEVQQNAIAF